MNRVSIFNDNEAESFNETGCSISDEVRTFLEEMISRYPDVKTREFQLIVEYSTLSVCSKERTKRDIKRRKELRSKSQ